jgi:uncharacterized membrane protein YfcA
MDYPLLLMSFLVGIMIGLTSMGGAALMAPFLILVIGVKPSLAVQTDLIYGAVTKIVGAFIHVRQKTVDMKVALRMAWGSVPGGILGSLAIVYMNRNGINADFYLKRAIGFALVTVGIVLISRLFGTPHFVDLGKHGHFLQRWGTIIWGALVGFCVGLTSVGSGSLIAPFLMMLFPLSPATVVGTDVMHAAILVSATGLLQALASPVDWRLVSTLLAGSIPGVLLGSLIVPKVPARALRAGLAVLLLATGFKLI